MGKKIWHGKVVKAQNNFITVFADGKYFYMLILKGRMPNKGEDFDFQDAFNGQYIEANGCTILIRDVHKLCRDVLGEHQGDE